MSLGGGGACRAVPFGPFGARLHPRQRLCVVICDICWTVSYHASLRWGAGGYSIRYGIDIDQGTVWLLLVGLLSSSLVGWSLISSFVIVYLLH